MSSAKYWGCCVVSDVAVEPSVYTARALVQLILNKRKSVEINQNASTTAVKSIFENLEAK